MATTFSAAMERTPLRMFQIATFAICMLVLTCDGIDQQLLGIIAPKVIAAFGRECTRRGIYPTGIDLDGQGVGAWRGVPLPAPKK